MHLLDQVTRTPDATQRDIAKRIGVALGLTNLMLRRLATKGYIKIINVQKSRLRYLITPQGMIEKARLTSEYIEYSLAFYRHTRSFLRDRFSQLARDNQRRLLLWGTGELAEIAVLTIQEVGLELVGVVEDARDRDRFLGHAVHDLSEVPHFTYDWILAASMRGPSSPAERLGAIGVPTDRIIVIPQPGTVVAGPSAGAEASKTSAADVPRPSPEMAME